MTKIKKLLANPFLLLIITAILFVVLVLLIIFFPFAKKQANYTQLTTKESSYKESLPQQFMQNQQRRSGTLVVESSLNEVRVVLNTPEEEVTTTSKSLPVNTTPFRVTQIPTGSYSLIAAKDGYNFKEIDFKIKDGQVTRIFIELHRSEDVLNPKSDPSIWMNKLPIQKEEYVIDYDSNSQTIKAKLKIKTINPADYQAEAEKLSEKVYLELKNIGVNINSQKVEFILN